MSAPLFVLTGCTACGKTAAALAWAERFGAEIVSCDSLLFYRGMDIGTAKPTADEQGRVPHHLIDILDVTERMDVRTYTERARAAIADIDARDRRVLVTGGSGFYLRSFFAPVADDLDVDDETRAELERELATAGLTALVERLKAMNPAGLGGLDTQNPRRVVRALERCLVAGRTLLELQAAFRARPGPFRERDIHLLELARDPQALRARIARRVAAMFASGLIDEVRTLRARGLEQNPSAARAIGYRETLAWLDRGATDHRSLMEEIVQNSWRLVRKQRTWFRTQLPVHPVISIGDGEDVDIAALFPI